MEKCKCDKLAADIFAPEWDGTCRNCGLTADLSGKATAAEIAAAPMVAPATNLRARVYRGIDRWTVIVRDSVYDGAPRPRYVSQRDFEFLSDAETWAKAQTGKEARVSI